MGLGIRRLVTSGTSSKAVHTGNREAHAINHGGIGIEGTEVRRRSWRQMTYILLLSILSMSLQLKGFRKACDSACVNEIEKSSLIIKISPPAIYKSTPQNMQRRSIQDDHKRVLFRSSKFQQAQYLTLHAILSLCIQPIIKHAQSST